MYSVVGNDGQVYGPVDMATLSQWIAEGRIVPTTNLIDPLDGRVMQAQHAPALMGTFPETPTVTYPPFAGTPGPTHIPGTASVQSYGYPRPDTMNYATPPKNKATAIILAIFLGGLGIHRFYLGHTATAVAMLLLSLFVSWFTCGLFTFIWVVIDVILIATGSLREANGRALV